MIAALFCLPFVVVSTSGVLGLALTRWRRETLLMLLFFIGYSSTYIHSCRGSLPFAMVPFLAILAAYAWTSGWITLKERWATRSGKMLILLAFVGSRCSS